jgi:translation initiation factor IF-2
LAEGRKRLHQVAKDLGLTPKQVMEICDRLGISYKNHLSTLSAEDVVRIEAHHRRPPAEKETPAAPSVPPFRRAITERNLVDLDAQLRETRAAAEEKSAKGPSEVAAPRIASPRPRSRPLPTLAVSAPARPKAVKPTPAATPPQELVQQPKARLTPEILKRLRERQRMAAAGASPPAPGAHPGAQARPEAPSPTAHPAPVPPSRPVPKQLAKDREPLFLEEEGKPGRRGGPVPGRKVRQVERGRRAAERSRHVERAELEALVRDEEELPALQPLQPLRRRREPTQAPPVVSRPQKVVIEPPITVRSLSEALGIKVGDLLKKFLLLNRPVHINAVLSPEDAMMVGLEYGVDVEIKKEKDVEEEIFSRIQPDPSKMVPRPPVVTFLGHVDHGKTSLLDAIRRTNIASTEAGGITQCIRAWQVERNGHRVTFLDTPGHEAFTAMRARGAQVTDIAVLVVAADDGVMPQTVEAVSHAKAAQVPIVVAINKVDLPTANVNRVLEQLARHGVIPDIWDPQHGVPCIQTSAVTGQGIEELLETLILLAEMADLKADPTVPALGTCLEAARHEGRGVLATFLVRQGTLRKGDIVVCGLAHGRIRAMYDDQDRPVESAGPGTPVLVAGLDEVPEAGEKFVSVPGLEVAREVVQKRREQARLAAAAAPRKITLQTLLAGDQGRKELRLILRADVQGSLEAIVTELEKFRDPEVEVQILHKDVGAVTESDVLLADASKAIIIGFNVGIEERARQLAEQKGVEIRRYAIIYDLSDDIRQALEGMLTPERQEDELGRAEVLQTFKIRGVGTVAGCRVTSGIVERNAFVRVLRDGRVIYPDPEAGKHVRIASLKRFQEDVREVRAGYECGIRIEDFNDVKVGDVLEIYRVREVRRRLGDRAKTAAEPVLVGSSS